jgi:hypothetical protein
MENFKDTVFLNQRLISTRVISKMENTTEKESILGAQEILTKDPMKTARNTVMAFILILMGLFIKDNGRKANAMAKESKYLHKEGLKRYLSRWAKELKLKVDKYSYSFFTSLDYQYFLNFFNF